MFVKLQYLAQMLPPCAAEVAIAQGIVPRQLAGAHDRGVLWQAGSGQLLLEVPETARLLIGRNTIEIEALVPDACERLQRLVRRTPLAALLWLNGAFASHAAAVEMNGGAVLLMGTDGHGKSTLAAALMARGARLLADDVAPLLLDEAGRVWVYPVWPELVVWPDAVRHLFGQSPPPWLMPAPPDRFEVPYWAIGQDKFCAAATPLSAVYCLVSNRLGEDIVWAPVGGLERLTQALLLPYHERIAAVLCDRATRFRLYGAIAGLPYTTVSLPQFDLDEIDRAADTIVKTHHG